MNSFIYLAYPALLALLFYKASVCKSKTYNQEALSHVQTKAILGALAICIILHHISQKLPVQLSAKDPAKYALEPFRGIGYLFVAYFLFCSGFGLYQSLSSKPGYLNRFLLSHITPVVITFLITDTMFFYARVNRQAAALPASTYCWFVFVIIILYIGFYLCFRFLRTSAAAALWGYALIWCILCRIFWIDTWWYNSVLAFPLGVSFAKRLPRLIDTLKKKYPVALVSSFLLTALLLFLSSDDMRLYRLIGQGIGFAATRDILTVLQLLNALSFSILLTLLSMKIRIGNKFLSFLGAMTLEIYLVHVLFVELFCKTFIGQFKAFFYIKNPFLYLLAVLVLTLPIAFVIRKIRETLSPLIAGGEDDISWVLKILRTAAIAAIAILLLSTAYFSISSHFTSFRMRDTVSQYQKDFNTMTEVDGKMLSAYVAGEGEHTILILGDAEDPAPSMLLRPLADHLAEDYRVILPDFFGCGFSDPTDKPRNAKALAEELHTLTEKLTGGKPVTIFSYGTSGVCALTYLSEYPEDVEGLMGYDLLSPEILKEKYDNTALSKEQIFYAAYCSGKHMQIMSKLMKATGFIRMELVTYNEAFTRDVMKDHIDTLDELFIRNYANPESIQYRSNMMTDARDLQSLRLPTGFPAIFLSSNWSNAYEVKKPAELLKKLISDENCQRILVIAGDSYSIYYQARGVAKRVKEFMKDL